MQAVLNKNEIENLNIVEDIEKMIRKIDNVSKNEIENNIVKMGDRVASRLVNLLPNLKGIQRGVVAMSLIRIGKASIEPLAKQARENKNFAWVCNYLISEIIV